MSYIQDQRLGPDDSFDTENVEFVNCYFESITFEWTNFINIKISECTFDKCEFDNCNFRRANFDQVIFMNTRISDSQFLDCNLENTILDANIRRDINVCRETNFTRCNMVNLTIRILLDGCVFDENEYHSLIDMSRNYINNCTFSSENMASGNINWSSSEFIGCYFFETNLYGAHIGGTREKNTEFMSCNFTNANLSHTNLEYTLFQECILNNVNLTYSDVYYVFIENSEHANMRLDNVNTDDLVIHDDVITDDEELFLLQEEQQHQGVAFEIHNAFNRLDVKKLVDFINSTSPPPISDFDLEHFMDSLKTFLTGQVESLLSENRDVYIERLNAILDQMSCIDFNYEMSSIEMTRKEFLLHVISFAKNQDTDFYKNYLKIFIDDSYEAYGRDGNSLSCPKGVMERMVLSLYFASVIICPEKVEECATPYKELIEIVGPAVGVHIDFGELQKEWYKNVASSVPEAEREHNYINFMTRKMNDANAYSQQNIDRITREAREMADADMFSDENVEMYQEGGMVMLSRKYFV